MKIEFTKEELQAVFDGKGKKGLMFLSDPIFDDLWKTIGMNPPKRNNKYGWVWPQVVEQHYNECKEQGEACIDHASSIDQKYGRHDYRCCSCGIKVDYFIGGEGDWWNIGKPAYCPNCGVKLGKVYNDYRKEVKPSGDSTQDCTV